MSTVIKVVDFSVGVEHEGQSRDVSFIVLKYNTLYQSAGMIRKPELVIVQYCLFPPTVT